MAHAQSMLQVITHAKNLCSYVMTTTQKSLEQFRFSLYLPDAGVCTE